MLSRPPPPPNTCIVCEGARTWRGEPCWCCVLRLAGPPEKGRRRPTTERQAIIASDARCVHCGGADRQGGPLLRLGYVGVHERVLLHAWCWEAWAEERDKEKTKWADSKED
jgi:hypothetical protein